MIWIIWIIFKIYPSRYELIFLCFQWRTENLRKKNVASVWGNWENKSSFSSHFHELILFQNLLKWHRIGTPESYVYRWEYLWAHDFIFILQIYNNQQRIPIFNASSLSIERKGTRKWKIETLSRNPNSIAGQRSPTVQGSWEIWIQWIKTTHLSCIHWEFQRE